MLTMWGNLQEAEELSWEREYQNMCTTDWTLTFYYSLSTKKLILSKIINQNSSFIFFFLIWLAFQLIFLFPSFTLVFTNVLFSFLVELTAVAFFFPYLTGVFSHTRTSHILPRIYNRTEMCTCKSYGHSPGSFPPKTYI